MIERKKRIAKLGYKFKLIREGCVICPRCKTPKDHYDCGICFITMWHLFHSPRKVYNIIFTLLLRLLSLACAGRLWIGPILQSGLSFRIWKRVLQGIQKKDQAGILNTVLKKIENRTPLSRKKEKKRSGLRGAY